MEKNKRPVFLRYTSHINLLLKYTIGTSAKLPIALLIVMFLLISTGQTAGKKSNSIQPLKSHSLIFDPQDTFPVPAGNPKQLFYLQRTTNTNTIVCELNLNEKGIPDPESPVHVFWIKYAEGAVKKELNYIQRVFAYGIKSQIQENGSYKMHFVSYKNRTLTLMNSPKDNKYHVYTTINKKEAILNRIFVKVEGGTFWVPNVVYMELKGYDLTTGKEVMERFKP